MKKSARYTDEELIARFQQGDEYAFEEIVHRYKNRLLNFAYRFLYDKEEAEDVVQDTFFKVYTNRHAYREIAKFSTWIYTITANLAKTILRKRKRRKLMHLSQIGHDDKDYEIPSISHLPEHEMEVYYSESAIQSAMEKLPEHFRTVVILRDIQGLSYEEISAIMNIPLGTVKSRINRARLKLQEHLRHLKE